MGLGGVDHLGRGAGAAGGGGEMNCMEAAWELFLARCADGDMAARFGRPDIYVADLERMKE